MSVEVTRRGPSIIGCAVIMLLTLVIAVLAVGWWRNWYDVAARDAPKEMELDVRIDKEKVGRDFGKLRDETQRRTESARVAAELETIDGTVVEVNSTQVTVRVAEQDHSMRIDEATGFYVGNEEASLQSVQEGDQVRVTYQHTDSQKRASRVTVLRDDGQ